MRSKVVIAQCWSMTSTVLLAQCRQIKSTGEDKLQVLGQPVKQLHYWNVNITSTNISCKTVFSYREIYLQEVSETVPRVVSKVSDTK